MKLKNKVAHLWPNTDLTACLSLGLTIRASLFAVGTLPDGNFVHGYLASWTSIWRLG
jgi:hypothetical protein